MKIQNRQNYCLLLSVNGADYDKASLTAVYYDKDIDGFWREVPLAAGTLDKFEINNQNKLIFVGKELEDIYSEAKEKFAFLIEEERQYRIDAEKQHQENLRRMQEAEERRYQEIQKQKSEAEERFRIQKEEAEKRRLEFKEKKRIEEERIQEEHHKREEDFKRNMQTNFSQQQTIIRDAEGNRWVKCEFCGKIAKESKFNSYGGSNHVNLGTCKEFSANNPAVKQQIDTLHPRKKFDPNVCPECGGTLREKNGQFGKFIGCSNYPRCRYTRRVKN